MTFPLNRGSWGKDLTSVLNELHQENQDSSGAGAKPMLYYPRVFGIDFDYPRMWTPETIINNMPVYTSASVRRISRGDGSSNLTSNSTSVLILQDDNDYLSYEYPTEVILAEGIEPERTRPTFYFTMSVLHLGTGEEISFASDYVPFSDLTEGAQTAVEMTTAGTASWFNVTDGFATWSDEPSTLWSLWARLIVGPDWS